MIKEKTRQETLKEEREKDMLIRLILVIGIVLFTGIFVQNISADEIKFGFKSPSFNGVGTSAHYLTIESQE